MGKVGKIKVSTLLLFVSVICVSSYALLEDVAISIPEFASVLRPLLYIGGICILSQYKLFLNNLKKKGYFIIAVLLLLFYLLVIYSTYINMDTVTGYSPIYATVSLIMFLAELFALMIWIAERGMGNYVVNILFYYILILVMITDIIEFAGIVNFTDGTYKTYLLGTKFSVSYMHIQLLALFLLKQRSKIRFKTRYIVAIILFSLCVLSVARHMDCVTGVIGCVLLVVFILLFNKYPRSWLKIFSTSTMFLLFLIFSVLFAFTSKMITEIPMVEDILINVFNRNQNMTGRAEIFAGYALKMVEHWRWGYGYGGAYNTSMSLFGYANVQNGLLQWILQVGIFPVLAMLSVFGVVFWQLSKKENVISIMPIVALIYVFIILGAIEITISMSFFLWIALIFMWIHQKGESK